MNSRASVYIFTFLVALCSIIYELMFSQLFTVVFGGTVKQYSITIGLFLFSLGIGSYLYSYVPKDKERFFVIIEMLISVCGLLGILLIIKGSTWMMSSGWSAGLRLLWNVAGYLPVVVVGVLSGVEIPLLAHLGQKAGVGHNVMGKVLGTDYLGSLCGTLLFSLILFPNYGIVVSAFFIALVGLGVSVWACWLYERSKIVTIALTILLVVYLCVIPLAPSLQDSLMKSFRGSRIFIQVDKSDVSPRLDYNVSFFKSTPYQDIIITDVFLNKRYYSRGPFNYTCLYLDNDMQFCTPLIEAYHGAMIDVPLQYFPSDHPVDMLIIGGGDWIGVRYALQFSKVRKIDLVDIDKEFTELAKRHPFIAGANNGSYDDKRVNVYYEDGFYFVLNSDKKYDLIVVDLPGITQDKLANLYSVEFFSNIHRLLKKEGVVVSWVYSQSANPLHAKVFSQVMYESGFKLQQKYFAYLTENGSAVATEQFSLFADDPVYLSEGQSVYLNKNREQYHQANASWIPLVDQNIRAHSVFWPNGQIVIKSPL